MRRGDRFYRKLLHLGDAAVLCPNGVLSVCVGAVEVGAGATAADALEEASIAVFAGKDTGRNRVVGRLAQATQQ